MDWKRYTIILVVAIPLFVLLLLARNLMQSVGERERVQVIVPPVEVKDQGDRLVEDRRLYQNNDATLVENIYVTIYDQNKIPENDISFYDLNESYKLYSNLQEGPKLEVKFQTGTENGPLDNGFTKDGHLTNATIELRGRSSRLESQKSYKIRLLDSAGLWYRQNVINLNKHQDDKTRIRNKLAFDYFKKIPDLVSLRTNFVHLHIKDLTENPDTKEFEDYGLFTHVEQLNEKALAARGLNTNGHLYKAENFEFNRYPEIIKTKDDPSYNKKSFESVLKINGDDNHQKLINMLNAVNDYSTSFEKTFETYFNEENYLTFLATNILFGNYDTMSTNYYLYNPLNTDKWYFIPWDFDKALGRDIERNDPMPSWQKGLSRYWGTVVHKRYFRDPENVEKLTSKINELGKIINTETTKKMIDDYYPIAKKYVSQSPDLKHLSIELSEFNSYYYGIPEVIEMYKKQYFEQNELPMPIFLHYEMDVENKHLFKWETSHDLQGDPLKYTFQLSNQADFSTFIVNEDVNGQFEKTIATLEKGRYYFRVLIQDNKGHTQIPFDYAFTENGVRMWGVKEVIVQ
ncbi:MAG: CotH kinase family protein [Bacillus sp. (in: Bacteria)]|nr:CotH kinase family protein [Bacillus sp. (in: firmicutes)]